MLRGATAAFLVAAFVVPVPVVGDCPERINDCGIEAPSKSLSSSGIEADRVIQQLISAEYELTVTMEVDGAVRSGAEGTVTLRMGNASGAAQSRITIWFPDVAGIDLDGQEAFQFDFDPASGIQPEGRIPFEVTARSGKLSLPVVFTVEDDNATHSSAAVLSMPVRDVSGSMDWLLPAVLGFLVGAVLSAVAVRRRP